MEMLSTLLALCVGNPVVTNMKHEHVFEQTALLVVI